MASRIKVFVRMRPALPGEFDAPGCFSCCELEEGAGNWIRVRREAEPVRHFTRVFGPQATQEDVFRSVGVRTVDDVLEGYNGCIFVYGQTSTGKTHTMIGEMETGPAGAVPRGAGLVPRCVAQLFERRARDRDRFETTVQMQYAQIYREAVQDLWNLQTKDLPVRVDDDAGASIEGITTREAASLSDALRFLREGDRNRAVANTQMNSASSRSHACLTVEVLRRDRGTGRRTTGRLHLIDLAGSERVSKSGVSGDTYKETVAINQSLTTLGNCIAGLVNGEKVVAFRESKLTRLLQHSLTGHGRTSIIVTIRPDSFNMQETVFSLKFGERAQKVETQMTPAAFAERVAEMRALHLTQLQELSGYHTLKRITDADASSSASVRRRREMEVHAVEEATMAKVNAMLLECEDAKHRLNQDMAAFEAATGAQHRAVVAELRSENAGAIREIEKRVAAGVYRQTKDLTRTEDLMRQKLALLRQDAEVLSRKVDRTEVDDTSIEDKVRIRAWHVREELDAARRRLHGCRRSANEALSEEELRAAHTARLQQLRALQRRRDMLVSRAWLWDRELMARSMPQPAHSVIAKYAEEVAEDMKGLDSDAASSEVPTPSFATSVSPAHSGVGSSTSPPSSTYPGEGSSTAATPTISDDDSFWGIRKENASGASSEYEEVEEEVILSRVHFDQAAEEEEDLHRTREKLAKYLAKGTTVYAVLPSKTAAEQRAQWEREEGEESAGGGAGETANEGGSGGDGVGPRHSRGGAAISRSGRSVRMKGNSAASVSPPTFREIPTVIKRNRMSLDGDQIVLTPIDKEGAPTGDRERVVPLSRLREIVLGQYTKAFQRALEGTDCVPQGAVMPSDSSHISIPGLRLFFYRSVSFVGEGLGGTIDLVLNSDADFEAWTVGLLFAARIDPRWGGPLEIHHAHPLLPEMNDAEVNCCMQHHILPETYVNFRNALVAKDPPALFLTPIFIRSFAKVDLLHAFKLLSFLTAIGEVEVCRVNQVRFMEMQNAEREFQEERRRIRDLRQRIVNMLRKYRPCSAETTEHYLRNITGFEDEVLDDLIEQFGPEPDEDDLIEPVVEVQEREGDNASDDPNMNEDLRQRRAVRQAVEEAESDWFEHFFDDRHKAAITRARQHQLKQHHSKHDYNTIAGRLENIRNSLLCNDKLQEQLNLFVDPHVVPEPHLIRFEHLYLPALDIVDQFVSGENVSPVAGGSHVTASLASALSCALKAKVTDNVMLILGLEGSGKTLLAHFLLQHYLCKLDLQRVGGMIDPHVAINEPRAVAPSFTKAAQAARRAQAMRHFANRPASWIPVFIDVASVQRPQKHLLAEGLSKFFGLDYVTVVDELEAAKKNKKKGKKKDGAAEANTDRAVKGGDGTAEEGKEADQASSTGLASPPPLALGEHEPAIVRMARDGPLSWSNLQRNAPLLFIIDGLDAMTHPHAKGPLKDSLSTEDHLLAMAAHLSVEMDYEEVVGLEDPSLLTKESKARLFSTNKMQQWLKAKFIFTCRHIPQASSDWKNTHFLSFIKRFVAPSNTKKPLLPDLTSLSTVCLAPFNDEKLMQVLFRFVDINDASGRTFGRGFEGAYRMADELRRMRGWFLYCRTPGLLLPIVEVLSMVRRERKTLATSRSASPARSPNKFGEGASGNTGGGGEEEGLTLFSAFERFVELHCASRIERLGLHAVPIPLRAKDTRQAMKLFCYEAALAMAKHHVHATVLNSVLDVSCTTVREATRSAGLVQQDPSGIYLRHIGPLQLCPMWSSAPLANPPTVLGTTTAPWLTFSDEVTFLNRTFQDFFMSCVMVRQLLLDPRDPDNVANKFGFGRCEVLMTFLFDQLGQERLLEILAIVKSLSGGKHKHFPLAVLGSNIVSTLVFHNVSFAKFDFEGMSLVSANLRYAQLDHSDLRGCDLTAAVLNHAQLNHAHIADSCWREVVLKEWPPIVAADMLVACSFSPNGKIAVIGGFDGVVCVCDAPTARTLLSLTGHEGCVTGVAISRDGRLVVSGAEDSLIRVWEGATGDCLLELEGHTDSITSVAISHDGRFIASSSDDGTVRTWNSETGEAGFVCEGHAGVAWCVTYFDESRKMLSGGDEGEIMAWDAETGEHLLVIITPGKGTVRSVRMSPAGNVIAAAGDECVIFLFDVAGELIHTLEGHLGAIWSLDFSPFGGLLASGGADRSVRIWDVTHAIELSCNFWHTHELRCVRFNEEGTLLLSASCDKTCRTHAVLLDTISIVGPEMEQPTPVHALQLVDDVKIVVETSLSISVYEVETLHCLFRHVPNSRSPITCAFSPPIQQDDAPIQTYFGSIDGVLRVAEQDHVETSGSSLVGMLAEHTAAITAIDSSPNGALIATGSGDAQLKIWRVNEDDDPFASHDRTLTFATAIRTIKGHKGPITRVRIARSGKFVVTASADKTVRLVGMRDGRVKKIFAGHKAVVNDVQLSADEQMLVTCSADRTLRVWEVRNAEEIMCLRGHQSSVTCLVLNSSCRTIFSGSLDRTVRVWSMLAGTEDAILPTHQVKSIAVSSDDHMVCTGGFDGTVRVMLLLDMRWCIVRQLGPRSNVEFDCQRLHGVGACVGLTKSHKHLLESVAHLGDARENDQEEDPAGRADTAAAIEQDHEGDQHNRAS